MEESLLAAASVWGIRWCHQISRPVTSPPLPPWYKNGGYGPQYLAFGGSKISGDPSHCVMEKGIVPGLLLSPSLEAAHQAPRQSSLLWRYKSGHLAPGQRDRVACCMALWADNLFMLKRDHEPGLGPCRFACVGGWGVSIAMNSALALAVRWVG